MLDAWVGGGAARSTGHAPRARPDKLGAVSFLDPYEKNRRLPLRVLGQLAVLLVLAVVIVLLVQVGRWIVAALS